MLVLSVSEIVLFVEGGVDADLNVWMGGHGFITTDLPSLWYGSAILSAGSKFAETDETG